MCGIFGAIGQNVNRGIIRALAIANRERGKQSFGLFNSSGKGVKGGIDPLKALAHTEFSAFIDVADRWFIAGHTRHATHGKVNDRNAHPFRYGDIIGAHNGIVHTPRDRNYHVDSEYLIDQLNHHKSDYQTALADVSGYWGLSWFDGQHFYLQAHNNSIAVALADDGNWYYSSDDEHLQSCIGATDKVTELCKGRTIRFKSATDNPEIMPDFVSNDITVWDKYSWRYGHYNESGATVTSATTTVAGFAGASRTSVAPSLPIPQRYQRAETRKERKRRRRQERREARELAARGEDYGRLSNDEFDMANVMAQEAGYADLADFMWEEDCETEREAVDLIEKLLRATYPDSDQYDLWSEKDERVDIAGLDCIPF